MPYRSPLRYALRARWQLVALPVAKRRCRFGRISERPIKAGRKLHRVRQHGATVFEVAPPQCLLYRANAIVHHVGRCNNVRTGLCIREGNFGDALNAWPVVDKPVGGQHTAVAVVGVRAEADVARNQQLGEGCPQAGQGAYHRIGGAIGTRTGGVLKMEIE